MQDSPQDSGQHRLGIILAGTAALCWSSAGLFTRGITTDLMTMLFWRGLFSGSAVFLVFLIMERGKVLLQLQKLRWPAIGVAVLSASGMISGIGSLRYTSVADTMVIYATVPFVTAALAYFFIGERASRATMIASAVAMVGVIVMLSGAEWGGSMFGKMLAVLMTFSMASFSVLLRYARDVPMLPAMAASAWLAAFFCFWFAAPMTVDLQNFALIAAFGIVQNAAGLVFYTLGSKRIPASEATLLAALEVPFTPLWVWLFMSEVPARETLLGGAIVLAALFTHIFNEARKPVLAQALP